MEENRNDVIVDQETGEITEVEKEKRLENLRVVKVLLLGGTYFKNEKKKTSGMNLVFLDAVETDPKTGQPKLRGFNPCITCYIKEPSAEIKELLTVPVFTEMFIKISGNDDFVQFHSVLTAQEVALYRQFMGELVNRQ